MKTCLRLTSAVMFSVVLLAESSLNGTVRDSSGGVISGAVIIVHWDPSGSGNKEMRPDAILGSGLKGEFSVQLQPGFYDVFVSSPAFTPLCRKIRIRDGRSIRFDPRLPADALVIQELGDRFETPAK